MKAGSRRHPLAAIAAILIAGCNLWSPPAIEPGEWEVTTTLPGPAGTKGVPQSRRHCLSPEAAASPTLATLTGVVGPPRYWADASVAKGSIDLDTTADTPDRDVRNMPVRIRGDYGARDFAFIETITFLGNAVATSFAGRRIGDCRQ